MKAKTAIENGFKETEIGLIPSDWNFSTVGTACEKPQYGFTETASNKPIGPRFLRITDIAENGVDWTVVPYCKCPQELIEKYKLKTGDIVFVRIGATTGKSYIIRECPLAVYASYLIRVRTKSGVIPEYLYYFFNSDAYWKQIDARKGSSLKKGVNGSILAELKFPFPPLQEQQKTSFVLSKIQRAIEQQEKIIEKTKELKRSLMQRLFTYGLRGEGLKETEIGLMPKNWNLVFIGELITNKVLFIQNGFPCGKWNDKGIGILQIRPFNISDEGYIDLNTVKHIQTDKKIDSYLLKKEDVVFNNTNSEELVGKTALWQAKKEAVLSNHMTIIRILKKDKVVPLYLARLLHKK